MSATDHPFIPGPVLFNPLKHHAGSIREFIRKFNAGKENETLSLYAGLATIGRSQMDLYTGSIPATEIAGEITQYLESKGLIEENSFLSWLAGSNPPYRTVALDDHSLWVLLPGKIPGRWVHVHPARYSPHTIRVRSATLKTAIAVLCFCTGSDNDCNDPGVINHVRTSLLDLSPVKEISPARGTGRIIRLLAEEPL
jgi:hypothetical protein